MKQYCRYCSWLCVGDSNYCERRKQCLSDSYCKRVNKCKYFEFNEIDAFDLEKVYHPKSEKEKPTHEQIKLEI